MTCFIFVPDFLMEIHHRLKDRRPYQQRIVVLAVCHTCMYQNKEKEVVPPFLKDV